MINNILKKIEKANEVQNVELASHNIELALIDEINELTKIYESKVIPDYVRIEKERLDLYGKLKKLKAESKIAYDLWYKTSERTFAVRKEYMALAEKLGINAKDSEPIKKLNYVSEAKEEISRAYKTYDNIAEYLKPF